MIVKNVSKKKYNKILNTFFTSLIFCVCSTQLKQYEKAKNVQIALKGFFVNHASKM